VKPPFKISWEEITPAKAKEWLEKYNKHNRNLRKSTVDSFATDMVNDAWTENTQTISFGADGNLKDGQHRLAAIVRSGRSHHFLICRNVPDVIGGAKTKVTDSLDRGNARSVADVLKLSHGYKANALIVTAACSNIAAIAMKDAGTRVKKLSVSTTLSIATRFKAGLEYVCSQRPKAFRLRAAPICGAVAFAYAVAPRRAADFYQTLITGVGLSAESPILVLRNNILDVSSLKHASGRERLDLAELVLHTLYCVMEKKVMARIPKPGSREGADWFREQQKDNVRFLEKLFPSLEERGDVVTDKTWRPTPAAEKILRDKAISERVHGGGRVAKMQQRIARGEIAEAVK
jgi:hypothetical protein